MRASQVHLCTLTPELTSELVVGFDALYSSILLCTIRSSEKECRDIIMGIIKLHHLLKVSETGFQEGVDLRSFAFQRIAVDVSIWLIVLGNQAKDITDLELR